jgi:hypothetical protein
MDSQISVHSQLAPSFLCLWGGRASQQKGMENKDDHLMVARSREQREGQVEVCPSKGHWDPFPPSRPHLLIACSVMDSLMDKSFDEVSALMIQLSQQHHQLATNLRYISF